MSQDLPFVLQVNLIEPLNLHRKRKLRPNLKLKTKVWSLVVKPPTQLILSKGINTLEKSLSYSLQFE